MTATAEMIAAEPVWPAWFGADDVADWLREAMPGAALAGSSLSSRFVCARRAGYAVGDWTVVAQHMHRDGVEGWHVWVACWVGRIRREAHFSGPRGPLHAVRLALAPAEDA